MEIKEMGAELARELLAGKTLLYPTETVWGLGCDAYNVEAAERIYGIKERPAEKRFVMLVDSLEMLKRYISFLPQKAALLLEHYEKPLTIIYDVRKGVQLAPSVINEDKTVAIRVTRDAFCKAIISALGRPLVSTSANISGEAFPNNFAEISPLIKSRVDVIANYRQGDTAQYPPSAIVRVVDGQDLIFVRR